jgi:CheY-like chemotaxis protein
MESSPLSLKYRILVVDDNVSLREMLSILLSETGYEAHTAADGFDALRALRQAAPDLIISDLNMPNMSGFEFLSVVRRRFPHVPVIALSGDFTAVSMSSGVLADAFLSKGEYSPEQLLRKIRQLLDQPPIRSKHELAPLWIPRTTTGYHVLTCTECLRSFQVPDQPVDGKLREDECIFCGTKVRYRVESITSISGPSAAKALPNRVES